MKVILNIIGWFSCDSLLNLHFHFVTNCIQFCLTFLHTFLQSLAHITKKKITQKSFSVSLKFTFKTNLQINLKWPLPLLVDFILSPVSRPKQLPCNFIVFPYSLLFPYFLILCPYSHFSCGCWWGEPCGAGYCTSPSTCSLILGLTTAVGMQVSDLGSEQESQISSTPISDALQSSFSNSY